MTNSLFLLVLSVAVCVVIVTLAIGEGKSSKSLSLYSTYSTLRKLQDDSGLHPNDISSCNESEYSPVLKSSISDFSDGRFQRFLAVIQLSEQLTKSRRHLAEVMTVAKLTNRTLVLPRCGAGHIGNGLYYKRSVCNYFDLQKLGEYVDWVTEDFFLQKIADFQAVNGANSVPSTYTIFFTWPHEQCETKSMVSKVRYPNSKSATHNLTMAVLDRGSYICYENCPEKEGLPTPLALVSDSAANSADILVIGKTSPYQCFDLEAPLSYLTYPNRLVNHVNNFVEEKLGPRFLSIHWRMEMMMWRESTRRNFEKCANGLILTAQRLIEEHNLTGVFMASDISPDNVIHSDSMGMGEGARNRLVAILKNVHSVLKPAAWKDFDPNVSKMDSGVQGILDKQVCRKGHVFVYAPNICFGYNNDNFIPSSYTREIVDLRSAEGINLTLSHPWSLE